LPAHGELGDYEEKDDNPEQQASTKNVFWRKVRVRVRKTYGLRRKKHSKNGEAHDDFRNVQTTGGRT